MTRTVEIQTPGRLHFGLSSFGGAGRAFSGLGMMIDGGGIRLEITPSNEFHISGALQERVHSFARGFAAKQQRPALPECHIAVHSASPEHVGLGVGTQLGLAVVAGLAEWLDIPWRNAELLCQLSGRGRRSAIGTHGFLQGGLLVDAGKGPDDVVGQLASREDLPTHWRFVLIRQTAACGLTGDRESQAINALPPVDAEVTSQLHKLIDHKILPAARDANWQQFSRAVYQYGYQAGECFAPAQGGPFASSAIAQLVHTIRELGYPGVGQSSWGTTVFAIAQSEQAAEKLVAQLKQCDGYQVSQYNIARANNTGAIVHVTN